MKRYAVALAMHDVARLAARIRPYVSFSAGGMHVDVRKWLSHTYKGKEMDEMKFASLVDSAAKLISGAPFPSTHSFTKARQVVELILASQQPEAFSPSGTSSSDPEMPGMWDGADLSGGATECRETPRIASQQPQGVPEDVQRDAERYRYLRRALYREWLWVGDAEIGMRVYGACPEEVEVDAAIDARIAAAPSPEAQS